MKRNSLIIFIFVFAGIVLIDSAIILIVASTRR